MRKFSSVFLCFSFITIVFGQPPQFSYNPRTVSHSNEDKIRSLSTLFNLNSDSVMFYYKSKGDTIFDDTTILKSFLKKTLHSNLLFPLSICKTDSLSKAKEILKTMKNFFYGDIGFQIKEVNSIYKQNLHDLDSVYKMDKKRIMDQVPNILSNGQGETQIDSITDVYNKNKKDAQQVRDSKLKWYYEDWYNRNVFLWFPSRNPLCAKLYYNNDVDHVIKGLRYNFLQTDLNGGFSLYSELVSGILPFIPLRASFGSLISTTKLEKINPTEIKDFSQQQIDSLIKAIDSTNRSNSSFQRLLSSGGNAMLLFQFPILEINEDNLKLSLSVFYKLCGEVPAINSEILHRAAVNGTGAQLELKLSFVSNSDFGLAGIIRGTGYYGSEEFYKNLGISKKWLFLGDIKLGLYLYSFLLGIKMNQVYNNKRENNIAFITEIIPQI